MKRMHWLSAFVCFLVAALPVAARAEKQTFKIATLAPEGSAWMKLFHEWSDAIEKRTEGQIKFRYFAGGVAGDERDVVRKMRLGQINGAAITAVGLALIQPDVRVLELPFLFRDDSELDLVRSTLDGDFRKKFADKGYQLLAWGDVGPVRLYSNIPIKTKADLQQTKMWTWADDPFMQKLLQRLGVTGVPLGVPDVLPALQTGLINACNGSPLAAVALQWHSKVKFATSMVLSQAIGAVLLSARSWDLLPPALQAVVKEESHILSTRLAQLVRLDNEAALKKMQAQGIEIVPTSAALVKEIEEQGRRLSADMEGQLYSKETRDQVTRLLAEKRRP